jgi:chorismate synthase
MNTFGTLLSVSIFGESHGACVGVTLDGVPAGMPIVERDFLPDLERRKGGIQKGTTPRKEEDKPSFKSGVFNGFTTGAPITILFENNNIRSQDYEGQRAIPRPGHADFVAHSKFGGFEDYRGSGPFSARLTVGLVAAGVIAKKMIADIEIKATIIEVGGEEDQEKGLQKGIDAKDSVGGIIQCIATGMPVGWGEPFWDNMESVLAHAMFAIPAVKGIEFGAGFAAAKMLGSEHNDAIIDADGTTRTNHAGGIVGGISNGNDLIFRIAVKPTSSTPKTQESLNVITNELESFSIKGRHDLCVALRAPVIVEAMTALVLADFSLLRKAQVNHSYLNK